MTTPSGRPGFNALDRFGITGDDGSVPDLVNRTQEVITGVLKERLKGSPGWNNSTADVWANLRRGIPLDHALLEVIVNRLTGGLVTFPTKQDAIMALQKVPGLGDLVELLTGVEDGDEDDLGTFFLNVRRFFQAVDFTDPDFDPAVVHKAFVEIVVQPFIKSITRITAALLGPLSIGFLTDEVQTLLFEGGFDDPITIIAGDGVEHDATDGVPLTTPLGCAKVTCDGTDKSRASEVIKVGPNWVLKLGGRIKYQGLTAGADAIRLNLIPYANETTPVPGGAIMVATAGTVSGTSTGINGWGILPIEGSWTVPATGVSHVVVEWHVTDAATAGVVKFDELYLQSTEKIPQSFTKDLPEDLQTLVNEAIDLWQGLGERLHVDEWDDWLADTWAHTQAEANQIRDILAGLIVTPINTAVQAIKDWWTGIVGKTQYLTSGGTLPPDSVGSPTGGTNIGQDILDTLNGIWAGLRGAGSATGKTASDVNAATAAATDLITQVSSTAARLDASVSQVIRGGGGGATDQFEREDTDLGDDWDSTNTGAGAIATNGSAAYWEPSGGSAATQISRNINVETATNWQKVSFVLTEPLSAVSGWLLLGRMDSTKTTHTYMFVKKDYREIGYIIAGSPTVLTSSSDPFDPPPGAKISGHFGVNFYGVVDEDAFSLGDYPGYGNSLNVNSSAPAKGDAYRSMGLGAKVSTASGVQVSPGALELWTGGDSMSPPTVGVHLDVDTPVLFTALSGSGPYFPSGFFSVTRQSDFISFDDTTTTFTVELPGAYQIFAQLELNGALASGNTMELLLISPSVHSERSMRAVAGMVSTQMSPVVYLEAGDTVRLAYTTAGAAAKSVVGTLRVAKVSPPYFA